MTQTTDAALVDRLLACPFCGGKAVMMSSSGFPHGHPQAGGTRRVECDECYAIGPAEGSPRDGSAWNRRPDLEAQARRIEECAGLLADVVNADPGPKADAAFAAARAWYAAYDALDPTP